ncbi:MAG: ATP phosphoribosyltransferase regulatory subunit [Ectothiorhodospiraceae bacterium]|nr:ATP phosphoribosyltransferase regulatory subunit [Ectothiorhodospiraceae bacterium]
MSMADRWLLPEGIVEVLPERAARIESVRRAVLDLYRSWGYDIVVPPFLEYLESLLSGAGSDLDLQTLKLIDQLSGRLMGVRADMTPQVARIEARHLRRDEPVRLCYLGTVLRTLPDGLARSRTPMQVGAELYGHEGIESDCEILCLMLRTLELAGLDDIHVDLGHVGIFRGLCRQAGLDPEVEASLNEALQSKARPELVERLTGLELPAEVADMILALVDLNGGDDVIGQARAALASAVPGVEAALDALERLAGALVARCPGATVHFDLAELRGYHYHTGVVFAAFVPGHGEEVARGGRYAGARGRDGRSRPATGFSADLATLVDLGQSVRATPVPGPGAILAPWCDDADLAVRVEALRADGERVINALPEQRGDASRMGCDRILRRRDGAWVIDSL